jgi:hypothetical protein
LGKIIRSAAAGFGGAPNVLGWFCFNSIFQLNRFENMDIFLIKKSKKHPISIIFPVDTG